MLEECAGISQISRCWKINSLLTYDYWLRHETLIRRFRFLIASSLQQLMRDCHGFHIGACCTQPTTRRRHEVCRQVVNGRNLISNIGDTARVIRNIQASRLLVKKSFISLPDRIKPQVATSSLTEYRIDMLDHRFVSRIEHSVVIRPDSSP